MKTNQEKVANLEALVGTRDKMLKPLVCYVLVQNVIKNIIFKGMVLNFPNTQLHQHDLFINIEGY